MALRDTNKPILVKTPNPEVKILNIDKNIKMAVENSKSTDILTCKNGDVSIRVGGIAYTLTDDDVAIIPALNYEIEYLRIEPQLTIYRLDDFCYTGYETGKFPFIDKEIILPNENIAEISSVLRLIENENSKKLPDWKTSVNHLIDYLMILLERFAKLSIGIDVQPENLADAIRGYINTNYEKNITLSSLAEIFFVSPFHISHLFKENYGISPIQYLINIRMNASKELLIHTTYSLQEIAAKVGYPNTNYFNILFKRFAGLSPGAFRKRNR